MAAELVLGERDRLDALEAIAALRSSTHAVPVASLRALSDARLREAVESLLSRAGRCLIEHAPGHVTVAYDDAIADALAERGIGVLEPVDRAVLCLVLMLSVAAPRARGRVGAGDDWSTGRRLTREELLEHHRGPGLTRDAIGDAVTRLKHIGLLRAGHDIAPGPALIRLTPRARARLWEDLVLICAPQTHRAAYIRSVREAGS